MPTLFEIIKLVSIIQFLLIVLIFLLFFAVKIYTYYNNKRHQELQKKINKILIGLTEQTKPFKIKIIRYFKRHPLILMENIYTLDASIKHPRWPEIRAKIIDLIILPKARTYSNSFFWNRRYFACQFFALSLQKEDEDVIVSLMQDPIPLVSITASQLAIKLNAQHIIDAFIDIFSQARRIQQSFYSQIMSTADPKTTLFIKNRIHRETNPYIKAFCYRTLMYFPPPKDAAPINKIKADIYSKNIELKISSLTYFAYVSPDRSRDICLDFLNDKHWEVRAKAAQLLGMLGNESLAPVLEASLKDSQWWVRVNAAESLASLGGEGIKILKKQKRQGNKNAYEVANQILSTNDE